MRWMKTFACVIGALSLQCSAEAGADFYEDSPAEFETEGSLAVHGEELVNGWSINGCTTTRRNKAQQAISALQSQVLNNMANLRSCMRNAALVENRQRPGFEIPLSLLDHKTTTVTCEALNGRDVDPGTTINARAPVAVSGQQMRVDHAFLDTASVAQIASVMAHELMHNKGFTHSTYGFGSTYYGNTVPEQMEACVESAIRNGGTATPNPCPLGNCSCQALANRYNIWHNLTWGSAPAYVRDMWYGKECTHRTTISCQQLSDKWYIYHSVTWGTAPQYAKDIWNQLRCATKPNLTCQQMSNQWGISHNVTWGTAPQYIRDIWQTEGCRTKPR